MQSISQHFNAAAGIEAMAERDSLMHRLDPRVKVIAVFVLIIAVVSYGKYNARDLLPWFLFPAAMLAAARIPLGFVLRRMLPALPFALAVGVFNPLIDRTPMVQLGGIAVSGGWVSFVAIMLKFALTVSVTVILLATTGINAICRGLESMGVPQALAVQLMLLYRYLFVLMDEFVQVTRAHANRTFSAGGMRPGIYAAILGSMLLRSLERARRVHDAMECRGFDGRLRSVECPRLRMRDLLFAATFLILVVMLRWGGLIWR